MPPHPSPPPSLFHPSFPMNSPNDHDAHIDIAPANTSTPVANPSPCNRIPYLSTTPPTSPPPTEPQQFYACPFSPVFAVMNCGNLLEPPTAATMPDWKPDHDHTPTYAPEHPLRAAQSPPLLPACAPTTPTTTGHRHTTHKDTTAPLLPTTKPDTHRRRRDHDDAAFETARLVYLVGMALDALTMLTYLAARYRALAAGSVMEEAVVRVEFETRMRDVLMVVVAGVVLAVAVGGPRAREAVLVRRAVSYVGVAVLVYVVAGRGVDGIVDWGLGWL